MNFQQTEQLRREGDELQAKLNNFKRGINEQAKRTALVKVELEFHSKKLTEMTGHCQPVINPDWV